MSKDTNDNRPRASYVVFGKTLDVRSVIGGKAADEILTAHAEIVALRKRQELFTPYAAHTDYLKRRDELIADGSLDDKDIAELGSPKDWADRYASTTEMLGKGAHRRSWQAFDNLRGALDKLEDAAASVLKKAEKPERDLAEKFGIPYVPSSGAKLIADRLALYRKRRENLKTDSREYGSPDLRNYFGDLFEE